MATTDFVVKNGLVVTEEAQILSTTDATSSTDFAAAVYTAGGAAIAKKAFVGTDLAVGGSTTLTGDIAVNGGDITTNQTTFNLVNTTATTGNLFGAATAISIGAATGTLTVNNQQTVFNSTDSIQIPVGNNAQRDATPVAGQIRYNSQLTTFEGYGPGNAWGSLGGVRDVDGNTYIIPELTPGGNQNILYFYNNGTLTATLSETAFTLTQNTASSGTTSGALVVTGGAGIGGNLNVGGNQTLTGDLAVNGADITTTAVGTATVFNTNTTTVNAFGAATSISIGAATGTTTINNANTVVTGDLAVNGADITTTAVGTATLFNTNATTANAFGAATSITIGATTGTATIRNATTTITGNANVNGGTLATSQPTFNLLNATATTVNAFGAASTLAVGASTGTITINNSTVTMANATTVNVNGANPTFSTSSTGTLTLFNTNLATVTAFGTATTVNIGNATAAQTISIGNASTGASTYNFATAPTATGNTKTVNIGTAGASGSTTNVNIGSSIAGTTTINSGTVVGALTTQNLFNSLATVVNAFGAAGTINIGANSGTLTIGNPTVVGTQATVNLWNSTSSTVNFAGAATAVNIGASTGTTTINTPQLRIGGSDTGNFISFRGTTGDQPGSFNHTYIGERIHTATEASELLIFKGNDPLAGSGPDRVRIFAGEFRVDTYTAAVTDTFENIGASAAAVNRMLITSNGQVTLGAGIASTTTGTGTLLVTGGAGVSGALFANTLNSTVASGTAPLTVASTTVVTNLNADLLDGFNSAQASTVSTVAVRDASGDINVRLIRSEFANQATISGAMAFRVNNTTDNYIRFCSDTAAIQTFLNVPTRTGGNASGTWAINISGNAATVTNGVYTVGDQTIGGTKTFSSTISGSINGNAATVSGLTITSSANGINPDNVIQNQIGYNTSVSLFGQTDGGLYSSAFSSVWIHQIYGDFRTGQIATRGKNSGTWQPWRIQLDSSNFNSYAPTLTGTGASGTWGISISGNAATITNQANSATITASTGVNANHIVQRDGNGYIYANYINFNQSETENPTISSFFTSNGDGWARKSSLAHAKNQIRGVADGTWGINITGNAATATSATTASFALNTTQGFNSNWNTDFQAAPAGSTILRGDTSSGSSTGGPGGTWWFQQNMRHTNSSNFWGTQVAWGWEDNANILRTRNVQGGSFGAWVTYLNSNNFNSYSPTLTGTGASGTWGINITGNAATATNSTQLGGVAAASFPRTGGSNNGDWNFASNSNSAAYPSASIELRELNFGGAQTGAVSESPRLGFHWGGRVASQIGIETSGRIAILNNPGTGYEQLVCSILTATGLTTGATATAGSVTGQWTLGAGSTWQATFADLAEYYPSDEEYEPGTVLVFGGESEITMSTTANDRKLAGVVSTNPAYIMNAGCEGTRVCMALQGRVPVKVIGTVERGDMLVSSNVAGYAMVNNEPTYGCVIGKAIESKSSEEPGLILVSINI